MDPDGVYIAETLHHSNTEIKDCCAQFAIGTRNPEMTVTILQLSACIYT